MVVQVGTVGAAMVAGTGLPVVAPVMAAVAVTTMSSIALMHSCVHVFKTMQDVGCLEDFRWYCYPLAATVGGQCVGASALAIASGGAALKPELFYQVLEYARKIRELLPLSPSPFSPV